MSNEWPKYLFMCPYCDRENDEDYNFCCSECHCDWTWVNEDGETVDPPEGKPWKKESYKPNLGPSPYREGE